MDSDTHLPTPPSSSDQESPARRPGAPTGNLNAFKHGLYSKQVRQSITATLAEMPRGFQYEIDLLCLVIQRAAVFAVDAYNIDDAIRLLGTIARATSNLDRLVRHHIEYFYDNYHSPECLVIDSISEETNELLLKRLAVIAERRARQAALRQEQMSGPPLPGNKDDETAEPPTYPEVTDKTFVQFTLFEDFEGGETPPTP